MNLLNLPILGPIYRLLQRSPKHKYPLYQHNLHKYRYPKFARVVVFSPYHKSAQWLLDHSFQNYRKITADQKLSDQENCRNIAENISEVQDLEKGVLIRDFPNTAQTAQTYFLIIRLDRLCSGVHLAVILKVKGYTTDEDMKEHNKIKEYYKQRGMLLQFEIQKDHMDSQEFDDFNRSIIAYAKL